MAIGNTPYQCTCESRKFIELHSVLKYAGGGMGKVHAGYKCAECGRDISGQAFTRVEEIRLARQKMKEAQDALRELGDIDGAGGIDAQAGQATEIKVGLTD